MVVMRLRGGDGGGGGGDGGGGDGGGGGGDGGGDGLDAPPGGGRVDVGAVLRKSNSKARWGALSTVLSS